MSHSTELKLTAEKRTTSERSGRRTDLGMIILFSASGASGLMLEVVWSRMLGWSLGATTWSVMTILVAYLGGLGLGGIFWGLRAPRSPRPLRLFGWLECAIGLYTLAVPLLFGWLGRFLVLAGSCLIGERPEAAIVARVVAAVLALGLPTLLMGGTLPVLTQFAAAGRREPGRIAAVLYAANTSGAVVGCFVTGCWLIERLGVIETNVLAAVIDLGVGIAALYWDRRLVAIAPGGTSPAQAGFSQVWAKTALLIAASSGFCALAYEVLWTRSLLATVTDDTTYAFAPDAHCFSRRVGTRVGHGRTAPAAIKHTGPRLAAAVGNGPDHGGRVRAALDTILGRHPRSDQP